MVIDNKRHYLSPSGLKRNLHQFNLFYTPLLGPTPTVLTFPIAQELGTWIASSSVFAKRVGWNMVLGIACPKFQTHLRVQFNVHSRAHNSILCVYALCVFQESSLCLSMCSSGNAPLERETWVGWRTQGGAYYKCSLTQNHHEQCFDKSVFFNQSKKGNFSSCVVLVVYYASFMTKIYENWILKIRDMKNLSRFFMNSD